MVYANPTPVPYGNGITENQCHEHTGLRNQSLAAVISTNLAAIGTGAIGAAGGAAQGAFPTGLRAAGATWNSTLPVPMTPTLLFRCVPTAIPGTVTVRIQAKGYDQFGSYITETTPVISKSMTTTSYVFTVTLSKVFATLEEVAVMTSGVNSTGGNSFVSVGWMTAIDPTRSEAASFSWTSLDAAFQTAITTLNGAATVTNVDQVSTWQNWGIGTSLRLAPYGPDDPFPTPEIAGATGIVLRQKTTPTVILEIAKLPVFGQLSIAGAAPTTGVQVGRSLSGWEGCPHKFGFFSSDNWATKITGIELGGSSLRAGGLPLLPAQLGEDDMEFLAFIRTTIGTRRGSNRSRNYPNG